MSHTLQPLGINRGAYRGETIRIDAVLARINERASMMAWDSETFYRNGPASLVAIRSRALPGAKRVYISAGIHGDEPAGPLAARLLMEDNSWPRHIEVFLLPCLNPGGFGQNRRENLQGTDLNRDYRHLKTPEVRAHCDWLVRQPFFDVTLCLHEDWESRGFYLYELNPDSQPSLSETIVRAVESVCPIDRSEVIEDRPASNGIIRADFDPASRPQWPESFYLIQKKTRLSYTLEAPSDFPLEVRVEALVAGVRAVLDSL